MIKKTVLSLVYIVWASAISVGQIQIIAVDAEQDAMAQEVPAEVSVVEKYAQIINKNTLNVIATKLASEEFAGRETGMKGQKLAADYIADQFKTYGIPPVKALDGYFQEFPITTTYAEGVKITAAGKNFQFMKDYFYFRGFGDTVMAKNKIVFKGHGIADDKFNDYANTDNINGNVLMFLAGDPTNKKGKSIITGSEEPSSWATSWRKKIDQAKKYKPAAILIVLKDFDKSAKDLKEFISEPTTALSTEKQKAAGMPVIYISRAMADQLIAPSGKSISKIEKVITKKGKPEEFENMQPIVLDIKRKKEQMKGENVLGFIAGCEKPEEVVVVTAHYDHLGEHNGKIYYGADDNASGTSVIMNIAQAFAEAKKAGHCPSRSVLIMPVSGEEKDLLGSEYYTNNPVYPLENTVANLNVDMVGRIDKKHEGDGNYIYLIGSDRLSNELHEVCEQVNEKYSKIKLDYTYNDPNDPNSYYTRSDHYNFAKNNVPVIFYFNGEHPDYHKPTDTIDKLDFDKMEKIGRLIFYTAWELANRPDRVKLNEKAIGEDVDK